MAKTGLTGLHFLALPGNYKGTIGSFKLDPKIPLPVEEDENGKLVELTDLTPEKILAGLLKIMAWDRSHGHFNYYRDFVLTVKPDIYQELSSAAIVKADSGDFGLAEEIFLALEGLDPQNPRTILNLAILYENQGRYFEDRDEMEKARVSLDLAGNKYSQALGITPPLADAYLYAGYFHLKNHNLERAKPLLDTFFEMSKDEDKVASARKVLAGFEKQTRLDTVFKEAYDFILLGQEEKGLEKVDAFLASYPEIWNGWFLKGWAHRRLGQFTEAKAAFLKTLDLEKDNVDTLNELAICEMEAQNFKQARLYLGTALAKEPENIKIISNLGVMNWKLGKLDEARGFFKTVLEIAPEDPVSRRYLEELGE